jgi:hypothetical protein
MSVPTFVQSVSLAPANTTSIVLTLNGVVTGNDVLVCVDATSGFDSYSVSDGVNSYVSALGPITSPPNNQFGQWFIAKNVTGGNLTITVSTSISTTHFAAAIEVSGVDSVTPIQNTDFAGAQNTSPALGNATATSKANTLAIAMTTAYGLGGFPVSQTLDAAWTQRENIAFAAGTPKGSGAVGTQLVVTSGNTVQADSTLSRTASWLALTLLLNPTVPALTLDGAFQYANTARVANGSVSFALREYHDADGAVLLAAGTPVVASLDSNGAFSVSLPTFDSIVPATPYAMVVSDAQGNFLMQRNVVFSGSGSATLNNIPVLNDGSAFPPQYPSDTGYRLIQGGFGSPAANGSIIFKLYQPAVTTAGVQIVPTPLVYRLDGSGNLPGGVYLYLSAALAPNTVYLVSVFDVNGNLLSKAMYSLSETAPAVTDLNDLSTELLPGVSYDGIPQVFFVAVPWQK